MTTEQINDYLEKRIAELREERQNNNREGGGIVFSQKLLFAISELEAVHKLTNVIQSRSSQETKVK